jgi:L-ribulose-5-phosphate 4-epimerase
MLEELKEQVWHANINLVNQGAVVLTWGNVSGLDRNKGLFAIKPSGVPYDQLKPEHMVIVDLDGKAVEGEFKPSSDTPSHVVLYREFNEIAGVTHTHSPFATAFAQANKPIPCLGTTHADHFHGEVPVTRFLTEEEVTDAYEKNTGKVIAERFADLDCRAFPGTLVPGHGPFTWGKDAQDAVKNSVALEAIAKIALATYQIAPDTNPLPQYILDKHYFRKHGPNAYYGQ